MSVESVLSAIMNEVPKTIAAGIFARLQQGPSTVAVGVCRTDTNLGLALMKMRGLCKSATI